MPVIIVGADTAEGNAIAQRMTSPEREVRVFVSDPGAAERLRALGAKAATGDVSDASHIEGASLAAFTAVLCTTAATDDRERSFARDRAEVLSSWIEAVAAAGVRRVIWVDVDDPPRSRCAEDVVVDGSLPIESLVNQVVDLYAAQTIPTR
ncbi:MAG: NAD(P)H-binding protein [Acidimicrobiia bacterium]|nr:NAD(P)H-binding protein [Acidimicrobiia bacterium]